MIVEMNDIQEMSLADIETALAELEKTLAENEKKISSNLSKIQKSLKNHNTQVENCNSQIQELTETNTQLATKLRVLNQQKTDKLFEEAKAQMFAQVEQVKGLNVASLLDSTGKGKFEKSAKVKISKKSTETKNSENAILEKNEKMPETEISKKSTKAKKSKNYENENFENPENGNSENHDEDGLRRIINHFNLPEDASVTEVRRVFEQKKHSLSPILVTTFEQTLQSFE